MKLVEVTAMAAGVGLVLNGDAAAAPRRATVMLDVEGGPVGPGNDASLGQAACVNEEFMYPAFLGSERASKIVVAEARRLLEPYGVRVVVEAPPPHLPYSMVRIGGVPEAVGLDPKINGLACEVDCGDRSSRDTVFMFAEKWFDGETLSELEEDERARQVGRIAIHEVGHSWGLEHAGGTESVMARFPSAISPEFVSGCQPLDLEGESECRDWRQAYCPPGYQDADAELRAMFGDSSPDRVAPSIAIVWPPDGHRIALGESVEVEVEVEDNYEGFGWMVQVPALGWHYIPPDVEQTVVPLDLPEGRWIVRAEAIDHERHRAEAVVMIEVEQSGVERPPASVECACRNEQGPRGRRLALGLLVLLARRRRPWCPR